MKIQGVTITNPDKVLYPAADISKLEIINYYRNTAKHIMPYLKDRPLTLHRFPDGIDKQGFYQKNTPDYFPDFIKTIKVKTEEGSSIAMVCNNLKTLIYLANQGTIGFHIWMSRIDKLYKPDRVVYDLDPPNGSFQMLKKGAMAIRDFLTNKNIQCQLSTSGKRGLHVWYTQRRTKTYDQLHPEIKTNALTLEELHPDLFTTAMRKENRNGKIFIDYPRNSYAQTTVCPYSLRPTKDASIAMPISWNELPSLKTADNFTIKNVSDRLGL